MSRSVIGFSCFLLLATASVGATLLPAKLGSFRSDGTAAATPADAALWQEFGFVSSETARYGGRLGHGSVTAYQMKDATGALAAWEWLRAADSHACEYAPYCAQDAAGVLLFRSNYVLDFRGITPQAKTLDEVLAALPDRHESSLPALLTFVPRKDLVANSAKYVLGPEGLKLTAPDLLAAKPGFEAGAEAHLTSYRLDGGVARLALFYYPSPEMARLHTLNFKLIPGTRVKRSGVLVAVVLPGASERQAAALLSHVEYEAMITWNETTPLPQGPLVYKFLVSIILILLIFAGLCITAGGMVAAMRIYRRKLGIAGGNEAMISLHLSGD